MRPQRAEDLREGVDESAHALYTFYDDGLIRLW